MNFFKALLITNIIILILIVPSFIVLDKYLARHNDTSVSNIIASPENSDSGVIDLNNEEPVATPSTAPTEKTISIPDELLPTYHGFKWEVLKDKDWIDTEKNISFPNPEKYNIIEGVTTFRGNNFRNAPSYGTAQVNEKKLEKVWSIKIGYIDVWTGVGWNGQPAIVKWSDDIRTKMNIVENKKIRQI